MSVGARAVPGAPWTRSGSGATGRPVTRSASTARPWLAHGPGQLGRASDGRLAPARLADGAHRRRAPASRSLGVAGRDDDARRARAPDAGRRASAPSLVVGRAPAGLAVSR